MKTFLTLVFVLLLFIVACLTGAFVSHEIQIDQLNKEVQALKREDAELYRNMTTNLTLTYVTFTNSQRAADVRWADAEGRWQRQLRFDEIMAKAVQDLQQQAIKQAK